MQSSILINDEEKTSFMLTLCNVQEQLVKRSYYIFWYVVNKNVKYIFLIIGYVRNNTCDMKTKHIFLYIFICEE